VGCAVKSSGFRFLNLRFRGLGFSVLKVAFEG
jgi:hypothetical protein